MTILITGGSGFIGTQLVQKLVAAGDEVRVLDHHPAPSGALSVVGDIRDTALVERAVEGVDTIFHLAAEHRDDVQPVSLYDEVNVDATRILLEAADRASVERFLFTSSVAVYGLAADVPAEETPPTPFNDYGRTKLEAEALVQAWYEVDRHRRVIIVRPSVVFGEDNRGNVYNLLKQVTDGHFAMVGGGENRKSMAYVRNVSDFLLHVIDLPNPEMIYNYADKPDLSMNELLEIVSRLLGKPSRRLRLPYALGLAAGYGCDLIAVLSGRRLPISSIRVKKFCASTQIDTSRAQRSGFQPAYSLRQGLERTIRHEFAGAGSPPEPNRTAQRRRTARGSRGADRSSRAETDPCARSRSGSGRLG